jgi:large-conductance mechanosensitive channel
VQRANARTTLGTVLVARAGLEALLFAALLGVAQLATRGERPVPIVALALALTGIGIVLASVLRDARADRQSTAIAVVAIGAAAAFGVTFANPHPDGLEILTRLILFGIIGEAFVWRNLTVARGLVRWTDARNAGFAAVGAIAVASILPGAVDRTGLLVAGLAATAATGVALSLARSAEELSMAGREARGGTSRTTASGSALAVAIMSVVGAAFAPFVGDLLARAGRTIAPIIGDLLYGSLLALGYVAAIFVDVLRALWNGRGFPQIRPPLAPVTPEEEAEALRQIEATRPFVLGAVELVIAAIAVLLVIVLIDRMAKERRQSLPEGATLDRESAPGDGIVAFLTGLLPRRVARPRPPRDDGTPAGTLRALYWRYLARSEAAGVSWRAVGETPAEHQGRAEAREARFGGAAALVRAFEALRYGEREPDGPTLDAARAAIAAIEAPR